MKQSKWCCSLKLEQPEQKAIENILQKKIKSRRLTSKVMNVKTTPANADKRVQITGNAVV